MNQWFPVGIMIGIGVLSSLVFIIMGRGMFSDDFFGVEEDTTSIYNLYSWVIKSLVYVVTIPVALFILAIFFWNTIVTAGGMGWDLYAITDPAWEFVHIPSVVLGTFGVINGILAVVAANLIHSVMMTVNIITYDLIHNSLSALRDFSVNNKRPRLYRGALVVTAVCGLVLLGVTAHYLFVAAPPGW